MFLQTKSANCCVKQVINCNGDSGKYQRIKVLCDNSLAVRQTRGLAVRQTRGKLGNACVRVSGSIDHPRCAKVHKDLFAVHRFGKACIDNQHIGRLPMPRYVH